jgi:hypothetical protein
MKNACERRTIRVNRAVPGIRQTTTAASTKPQVSDPDGFSAPTGPGGHCGIESARSLPDGHENGRNRPSRSVCSHDQPHWEPASCPICVQCNSAVQELRADAAVEAGYGARRTEAAVFAAWLSTK